MTGFEPANLQLGKLTLYLLSYIRMYCEPVPRIELGTSFLPGRCSVLLSYTGIIVSHEQGSQR